jgi:hypothetical protein
MKIVTKGDKSIKLTTCCQKMTKDIFEGGNRWVKLVYNTQEAKWEIKGDGKIGFCPYCGVVLEDEVE